MPVASKLPGVLSFQRCLVPTDARFFNVFDDGTITDLPVVRHGIRGTQNVNKKSKPESAGATSTSAKRAEVSNIQTTDSAKMAPGATELEVRFALRFVDLSSALFACAPGKSDTADGIRELRDQIGTFISAAKESDNGALRRVTEGFTRNITNGRFLWRNRVIAKSVSVTVTDGERELATFDALSKPLNSFDNVDPSEQAVAEVMASGFRGDRQAVLQVTARVGFGVQGPLEVFPSQNYLEDKSKGFARPLYCVGQPGPVNEHGLREMGQAAFRDQKIGNALRTIDVWYPSFAERMAPIPVEPNGASLDAQEFFRDRKTSGFDLMRRIGEITPDNSPEGNFLLACIIRGGVYSGSDDA